MKRPVDEMISVELDDYLVNTTKVAVGSRMKGIYDNYLELLVNKHAKQTNMNKDEMKHLIILDSYDGAQHEISKKDTRNNSIISYSSLIITLEGIKLDLFPTESLNILIWQQLHASENAFNLFMSLENIYQRKRYICQFGLTGMNDCTIFIYDLHDAKMLYILTGHSLYNRTHKPFILCGCRRG